MSAHEFTVAEIHEIREIAGLARDLVAEGCKSVDALRDVDAHTLLATAFAPHGDEAFALAVEMLDAMEGAEME